MSASRVEEAMSLVVPMLQTRPDDADMVDLADTDGNKCLVTDVYPPRSVIYVA